jgi:hypothetical protein
MIKRAGRLEKKRSGRGKGKRKRDRKEDQQAAQALASPLLKLWGICMITR